MKAQNFCRYLSNQIKFEFDTIMPCCWTNRRFPIDQIQAYKNYIDTNENWEQDCSYCLNLERKGLRSHRTMSYEYSQNLFNAQDNDVNAITSIEFQIDTECNAACVMCGPWASTTWEKYNISKSTVINIKDLKHEVDVQSQNATIRRLAFALKAIDLNKVKQVNFIGGEPLLNNNHVKILDLLQTYVPLEQLQLRYTTNGSQFCDQSVVDLWAKVKRLHLIFSVDAVGKQFNYHRWPLQWHQVQSNIEKYLQMDLSNHTAGLSITLTPLNIYYLDLVQQWATELSQKTNGRLRMNDFNMYFHTATGLIDTAAVPWALRKMLLEKYGASHKVTKILQPFDRQRYEHFKQYISALDAKRKTNWKEIFPEIQHCFV